MSLPKVFPQALPPVANRFSGPRRLELKRPASAQPGISDTSTLATSGILTRKALEKISIPSSQVPHNLDQPQASASISPDAREIHEALDITPEDSATFSPVENLLTMFRTEGEALETAEVEQAFSFLTPFVDT